MSARRWLVPLTLGVLATLALLGFLLLFARLGLLSFVPLDIADAIIRLTPGALATQGIEALGPGAKLSVELAGSLLFIAAGGLLALLYSRRAPHRLMLGGLALATAAFALTLVVQLIGGGAREGLSGLALTGTLLLGWGLVLAMLLNRLTVVTPAVAARPIVDERRIFLLRSGGTLLAVALGSGALAQLLARSGTTPQVAGAGQSLPTSPPPPTAAPSRAPASLPSAAPTGTSAPVAQAAPTVAPMATSAPTPAPVFVTAPGTRSPFNTNETLYVISSGTRDPELAREDWRLAIGGAGDAPFSLGYDELLALPRVDQTSTLQCISNEVGNYLIGNCVWNGVRLADLLEQAGVQAGVIDIKLTAAEGYTESIPLETARDPRTLIVYGIDGEALAVNHGFPARLIVPGLYGEKNVKWLTGIEAVREDYQGYWQQRGWTDTAIIETTSVFDTGNPRLTSAPLQPEGGVVALGGIGFAGNRGVSKIELQIDGGEWREALLDPQGDPITWRFWRYDWKAEPGRHTLSIRATDGHGKLQTDTPRDPHPDGATGYHTFEVEVA
jgi:DMSO/TMAO reductase YedYZ molybdopterin-dependent catalytic subunit